MQPIYCFRPSPANPEHILNQGLPLDLEIILHLGRISGKRHERVQCLILRLARGDLLQLHKIIHDLRSQVHSLEFAPPPEVLHELAQSLHPLLIRAVRVPVKLIRQVELLHLTFLLYLLRTQYPKHGTSQGIEGILQNKAIVTSGNRLQYRILPFFLLELRPLQVQQKGVGYVQVISCDLRPRAVLLLLLVQRKTHIRLVIRKPEYLPTTL